MGIKLSNPVKSFSNVASRIIKKPTDVGAWKDAGMAAGTGGWLQTDSVEVAKQKEAEAKAKKASANALTKGKQEGFEEAKGFYGVGREELAPQVKEVGEILKGRVGQGGGDPVSAYVMNQAASAKANAARNLAQQGVKGGAAAGAIESIGRAKDAEVRASLYGQQKSALDDYRDYLGNIISGTKGMAYDTAALRQPAPKIPEQKSWVDDLFSLGGIV